MPPTANRLRAYLPPQAVQPSGSIAFHCHLKAATNALTVYYSPLTLYRVIYNFF
jgi:hypothetical protein